jgi:hypothetical protein
MEVGLGLDGSAPGTALAVVQECVDSLGPELLLSGEDRGPPRRIRMADLAGAEVVNTKVAAAVDIQEVRSPFN